ncbi:MAG: antA/AntB antirepressor family protein [Chromatiales bacterium]
MGVKSKFADWIRNRIKQYGFVENQDFIGTSKKLETRSGGTVRKNYWLTLDMAKELCMVERTERGREARLYFIDCEKKLIEKHQQEQKALPAPKPVRQRLLVTLENGIAVASSPIADDVYLVTAETLPIVVSAILPDKVLVDRDHFDETQRKIEGVLASLFWLDQMREDLRELLGDQ